MPRRVLTRRLCKTRKGPSMHADAGERARWCCVWRTPTGACVLCVAVRHRGWRALGAKARSRACRRPRGSYLTSSLLQPLISGQFDDRLYGRAYAGQLRRRGPTPSAAYGDRLQLDPPNSIGDGARVGRPQWCDHGVTHAAMPETMECARDHGVCTRLSVVAVAGGQACATAARGAWGRGGEKREVR